MPNDLPKILVSSRRVRYRLKGMASFEAIKLPGRRDKCGQSPYLFLSGKWGGQTVWVEPCKMIRVHHA